jgi:hypothetical protein
MNQIRVVGVVRHNFYLLATALLLAPLVAGCSNRAEVSGKVVYKGKAVTGGTVSFVPLGGESNKHPGKAGIGEVKSDGTYAITEGVVLGKNKILYSAPIVELPPGKELKEGQVAPQSPFAGLAPKQPEVEIKSGSNTIDIELGPAPAAKP